MCDENNMLRFIYFLKQNGLVDFHRKVDPVRLMDQGT